MQEILKILIGTFILILGVPLGDFLRRKTKEEIKDGQKWFILIVFICLIGAVISMFLRNDFLFFTFLFIAIVTSRSLIRKD